MVKQKRKIFWIIKDKKGKVIKDSCEEPVLFGDINDAEKEIKRINKIMGRRNYYKIDKYNIDLGF